MKFISVLTCSAFLIAAPNAFSGTGEAKSKSKGIQIEHFDKSVRPQDDFYTWANGTWIKNNPVPSTEGSWGSFNELAEKNYKILRDILETASKNSAVKPGSNEQKIGDLYFTAMDSVTLNKQGAKTIQPEIDRIKALKSKEDLIPQLAYMHKRGINAFYGFYAYQDLKNSNVIVPYLAQSGVSLPDKDYYLKDDESYKKIREGYSKYITQVFTLLGDKPEVAEKNAKTVLDIETRLAKASMGKIQLRTDIESQYNKMDMAGLSKLTPSVDWKKYFTDLGVPSFTEIIVSQPDFMKEFETMYNTENLDNIKTYLTFHLADGAADYLSDEFIMANFNFYGKMLKGTKEIKPRWKRSLAIVDAALGEALGQVFVEKAFSPESKRRVNEMVDNLFVAFRERISKLDWMSDSTKQMALVKLNKITRKLAYPDQWRDYTAFEVKRDSYFQNVMRSNIFDFNRMVNKMGKPVDKSEWGMSPPTINAYYNPTINEIVFPAGIMQPPFFNPDADDAVNYASMGAVIGHELTHGFDDMGCQFDADGNYNNWWSEKDKAKFEEKTTMVVKQFDSFSPMTGVNVNGKLTLGENIADLGGLSIAYEAFQRSKQGKPAETVDGYTPEQRFFISWAQVWKTNYTDEYLKTMINTNPHSPGMYRVNGPLTNMNEFYKAFNVKEGDKMFKPEAERAKVW